jgi:4-diphosphocytidyl-2-C-methyl-D-erythritol kinase
MPGNKEPRAVLRARAKINLGLRITGVLPNGYHEIDSLFIPLDEPADTLRVYDSADPGLRVACAVMDIDPDNNTLTRAYAEYQKGTGFAPSLRLDLEKGIPRGAGLGGGSSDAAELLKWLDSINPQPVDFTALAGMAERTGADVPFFLRGSPCRVRGTGNIIEPYSPEFGNMHVIVLFPDVEVSTAWAYAAWDEQQKNIAGQSALTSGSGKDTKPIYHSASSYDLYAVVNDFESVVFARFPILRQYKENLLRMGAVNAVMSGSGSSLVGIFAQESAARDAQTRFMRDGLRSFRQAL